MTRYVAKLLYLKRGIHKTYILTRSQRSKNNIQTKTVIRIYLFITILDLKSHICFTSAILFKKKKFYQKFEKYTYQSQFNEIYISHLPKKKKKK